MNSFMGKLGRVFSWECETTARAIAESAASLVGREKVQEVKVLRRADRFVPTLVLNRTVERTMVEQKIGALEAEVIVSAETLAPIGLFFRLRSELGPDSSPLIRTWEEDFSGNKTGPAQIVFVGGNSRTGQPRPRRILSCAA